MSPYTRYVVLALATAALTSFAPLVQGSHAATPDELIAKCDTLASDPQDSNRYATPVPDEAFAPGAAIDACKAAVDIKPDFARSHYQLGRAFHLADRDAEAFREFVAAAKLNYPPALKAIGDAYASGRGLPDGEVQSFQTAIEWFQKAINAGDRHAQVALDDARKRLVSSIFDPSIFQNSDYMNALYIGNTSVPYDDQIVFIAYVHGVAAALMGDTMFFIDQDCQHFVFGFNLFSLEFRMQKEAMARLSRKFDVNSVAGVKIENDRGTNDARTLMHQYSCKSPIVEKIAENIRSFSGPPITIDQIQGLCPPNMGPLCKLLTPGLPAR